MEFQDREASTVWLHWGTTLLAPKEALLFSLLFTRRVPDEQDESREDVGGGTPLVLGDVALVVHGAQALRKPNHIRVFCRIRPMIQRENDQDSKSIVQVADGVISLTHPEGEVPEPRRFQFEGSMGPETTQQQVFASTTSNVVDALVNNGTSALVFAYGQSGAGKTHTMVGPPQNPTRVPTENPGLIPRTLDQIFSTLAKHENAESGTVFLSVIEIYNEKVFDLLADDGAAGNSHAASNNLKVRQHPTKGVFVEGLEEKEIQSKQEGITQFESAVHRRAIRSTMMGGASSRGHTLVTIKVEVVSKYSQDQRSAKLTLVDMAGSERHGWLTAGLPATALKEVSSINASLRAFANVIMALDSSKNSKQGFVPYRDSRLTHVLRDYFEDPKGNVVAICCAGPADLNYEETLATMRFGTRALEARVGIAPRKPPLPRKPSPVQEGALDPDEKVKGDR